MNRITKALVLSFGGLMVSAGLGAGVANAEPTSTLNAHGTVRTHSSSYFTPAETHYPRIEGCRYWEKSTVSNNNNALQRFHAGYNNLVNSVCGGDGA